MGLRKLIEIMDIKSMLKSLHLTVNEKYFNGRLPVHYSS
jgi:hypothetical protein